MQWLFCLMLDFVFGMTRKFSGFCCFGFVFVLFVFVDSSHASLFFGLIFFKETRIS